MSGVLRVHAGASMGVSSMRGCTGGRQEGLAAPRQVSTAALWELPDRRACACNVGDCQFTCVRWQLPSLIGAAACALAAMRARKSCLFWCTWASASLMRMTACARAD